MKEEDVAIRTDVDDVIAKSKDIQKRESERLLSRTSGSAALHERALRSLPAGVASNFQAGDPYPVYLARGRGSHVWDVDGSDYLDFHGGVGGKGVGPAPPKIVQAIERAARPRTPLALTTQTNVPLPETTCWRYPLGKG